MPVRASIHANLPCTNRRRHTTVCVLKYDKLLQLHRNPEHNSSTLLLGSEMMRMTKMSNTSPTVLTVAAPAINGGADDVAGHHDTIIDVTSIVRIAEIFSQIQIT